MTNPRTADAWERRDGESVFEHMARKMAVMTSMERELSSAIELAESNGKLAHDLAISNSRLRDALGSASDDIDSYLAWAKLNGKTNSELVRIGKAVRAELAKSRTP